jgi:hypothetical protein
VFFFGFFLVGCFVDVDGGGGREGVVEAGEGEGVELCVKGVGLSEKGKRGVEGEVKGGEERVGREENHIPSLICSSIPSLHLSQTPCTPSHNIHHTPALIIQASSHIPVPQFQKKKKKE